jgi:hypothetical protein
MSDPLEELTEGESTSFEIVSKVEVNVDDEGIARAAAEAYVERIAESFDDMELFDVTVLPPELDDELYEPLND